MEKLSYFTTCANCDDNDTVTPLEGVGDYDRDDNTLYLQPCSVCSQKMTVWNWLDECAECGELHYDSEACPA